MTAPTLPRSASTTRLRWQVDPSHSEVGFDVRHLMFARVRGRFNAFRGWFVLDTLDFSRSSAQVEVDASSIDTHVPARDEHLRSEDFLDAGRHPVLTFRSSEVEGTLEHFRLTGQLSIRGVTRRVSFDAAQEGEGTDPDGLVRAAFRASATVDRRDFGLTWNQALETGGVLVGNEIRITIELQGIRED